MAFLLDTNVVSEPVARSPRREVIERLEELSAECSIAAPTWHELVFGCRRLPTGRRRRAIERYLYDVVQLTFPILAYGNEAAEWHAVERARLERAGRAAPFVDGQIAAIAHAADLVVVTRNVRDFQVFRGLEVVDWATVG